MATVSLVALALGAGVATRAVVAQPAPPAPAAGAGSLSTVAAAAVLDRVQRFYAAADRYAAKVRHVEVDAAHRTTTRRDGRLAVVRPGQSRWEYFAAGARAPTVGEAVVFDGQHGWVIDHQRRQLVPTATPDPTLAAAVSFMDGGGHLASLATAASRVRVARGDGDLVIVTLTPGPGASTYRRLAFVVDPSNWRVTQSIVIDAVGVEHTFSFYEPDTATPIAPERFVVDPAGFPGYRVVATATRPAAPSPSAAGAGPGSAPRP